MVSTFLFFAFAIALSPLFTRFVKAPIVTIEIILGSLGAYFGFIEQSPQLSMLAKIGFLFLLFLAGLEVKIKDFSLFKDKLLVRLLIYFATLYTLSFFTWQLLNLSPIYFVAMPIFSLGVIMALIKEHGSDKPWLKLALHIGIIGELVSILAITVLSSTLSFGLSFDLIKALGGLVGAILFGLLLMKSTQILFWWFPELKIAIMPKHDLRDQDVRFSMALFGAMIGLSLWIGLDLALGAFFAGLFLSTFFHHKKELYTKLYAFGFGFFAPLFFVYVGSTLPIREVLSKEVLQGALFFITALVGFRLVASYLAFYGYLNARNTLLFALSDSMPLLFIVAIATLGKNLGVLPIIEYYSLIVATIIDALILMTTIKFITSYWKEKGQINAAKYTNN